MRRQRERLAQRLSGVQGLTVYPGSANFLLVRLEGQDSKHAADLLLAHGIAVRTCANFEGLDSSFLRIAVRTSPENQRIFRALEKILEAW